MPFSGDTNDEAETLPPQAQSGEGLLRTLGLALPELDEAPPNEFFIADQMHDDGYPDDSIEGEEATYVQPQRESIGSGFDIGLVADIVQAGSSSWAGPSHWKYKAARGTLELDVDFIYLTLPTCAFRWAGQIQGRNHYKERERR